MREETDFERLQRGVGIINQSLISETEWEGRNSMEFKLPSYTRVMLDALCHAYRLKGWVVYGYIIGGSSGPERYSVEFMAPDWVKETRGKIS